MPPPTEPCDAAEFARLKRRLARARAARLEVETVSERSLRQLYLREQELLLLQDLATAANLSRSVPDVFKYVMGRICEFMAWPVGHAWLAEEYDGSVCLRSMGLWHARDAAKIKSFRMASRVSRFVPGEGLPGRIHASGEPAWLVDVASDEAFFRRSAAEESRLRSACAFPVLVGKEVVAVFEFFTDRTLVPDHSLLALMPQVSTHLGRAIERQRAEDRLIHDASHDPLTGLPNRALFLDRLKLAIARTERNRQAQFAVLFIDLDRFKVVNDSLGHLAGDDLIVAAAHRLKGALRRTDALNRVGNEVATEAGTLARMGGDEFTILLEDIDGTNDAVHVADRIKDVLRQPFRIDGQDVYTSASIGIATSASGYASADAVLRDADLAMYRAKALGKARFELFDHEMHVAAVERLALESDLRRALQDNEFILHYQPVVSLRTGEVVGFEALVRWQKPDGELVYPDAFIGIMEDNGLIAMLGAWVLGEACSSARLLQRQFPRKDPLTISVNLSPAEFAQPDLVAHVAAVVSETGIDPRSLRLEITESVMIDDTERITRILTQLKEIGVRLSIDDFGTGYSSLSYLHSLPLDVLKIDQSFVAAMNENPESLQIVRTIMSLACGLGMDVVAEGAEIAQQADQLRSLGCEFGQGYYFSKPVDLAGATTFLMRTKAGADAGAEDPA